MANPRLLWDNLIDKSGVVLTESSEASGLPVENIINQLRTKVWQTAVALAEETVVIDLLTAQAVTAIILLDHDLTAADSGIILEGNATDSWGSPSVSETLTWTTGTIKKYFASQTYRYWRLRFTKSSSSEARQIGRVFLGTYYDQLTLSDLSITPVDLSKSVRAIGGQQFTDIRPQYDNIALGFQLITKAEYDQLKTIVDTIGINTPIFVSINNDVEPDTWLYYAKMKSLQSLVPIGTTNYWSAGMALEEQL